MATSDVMMYCTKRSSPVYMCSLDAKGDFDAVQVVLMLIMNLLMHFSAFATLIDVANKYTTEHGL